MAGPQALRASLQLPSGSSVGRFVIRERLGEGGMGEVYRAEDSRLHRQVALKRMAPHYRSDPRHRELFVKEAERASSFTDPNIAALYDILEEGDELFLVMELVDGRDLRRRLREPLSLKEFVDIAGQCASALAAAHEREIVHCDIKPENIMITASGLVKVLDFGVARRLSHGAGTTMTVAGVSGTSGYMAPEMLREQPPGAAADIFALGVVCYEALAGFHPFLRGTFLETCDEILHAHPAALDKIGDTPPALARLVERMMAKQSADRPRSAADVKQALEALEVGDEMLPTGQPGPAAASDAPTAAASGRVPSRRTAVRRRWTRTLVLGVAVVLVAAGVAIKVGVSQRLSSWASSFIAGTPQQLAILPFTATAADAGEQAFSAGLAEAISSRLGNSPDQRIRVIAPSELLIQKVDSIEKARQQFGADLVLTGSVRESENLVRVTYSLVDARSARQLRGDTITVPAGDPFALEDQVMASLLRSLHLGSSRGPAHGTSDPAAYLDYLRGRGYLQDYTRAENIESATAEFKRALERDPNYALAFAGLGEAYSHKFTELKDPSQAANATLACQRALAIDPNLTQGHICLGTAETNAGNYEQAIAEFKQAVAAEPTNDDAVRGLGYAYEQAKHYPEAENTYRQAIQLRPYYWANYNLLGAFYWRRGRYAEAAPVFQQVISIAPDNYRGYSNLAGVYIMQGRYGDAIPLLQRSLTIRPNPGGYTNLGTSYFFLRRFSEAVEAYSQSVSLNDRDYVTMGNLADAQYWAPGLRTAARESYRKAIDLGEQRLKVNPKDAGLVLLLGVFHAMRGERQPAMDYLARARALGAAAPDLPRCAAIIYAQFGDRDHELDELQKLFASGGSPAYVKSWPNFDSLASDSRFQQLLKSAEAVQAP